MSSYLLAGGGTAGHVNPLLAVADELHRRDPQAQILALGTAEGLEANLVPARGYRLHAIGRVPLPRRPSMDLLRLPGNLRRAISATEDAIDEIGAQIVIGFGGYVSTPAYLAARRRGLPVVIHEQNARAGLANRLGARWAREVAITFPGTPLSPKRRDAIVTGLPLRREIAELAAARDIDPRRARAAGAAALGLDPSLPTIVVTGGSSGALNVNAAVASAAAPLLATGAQILHLTGTGKADVISSALRGIDEGPRGRYHVREYLPQMQHALAAADLVIARAGAGTVCELTALGLPAVYVPLPVGNGEQRRNATPVVDAGGGLMVSDEDFRAAWITDNIPGLLADSERLARMGAAARGLGITDAAARIVDLVEGVS
jgi:undecaprenyldiphospho-muramoylpentapeptide beta-N-acetylglucosaminyltransferase